MTSSETPSEPQPPVATAVEELPKARMVGRAPVPPWAIAAAVIPPGWFYILQIARWHLFASTVMLMLCWVAIVAIGYFAIRAALAASAASDAGWFAVRGRRDELEREKKSLLKAIKEIEFDHQVGKLSAADAAALTASYRARAIEVIKAIEVEAGRAMSVRDQILADVRARAALDAKVKKPAAKTKAKGKKESAA